MSISKYIGNESQKIVDYTPNTDRKSWQIRAVSAIFKKISETTMIFFNFFKGKKDE